MKRLKNYLIALAIVMGGGVAGLTPVAQVSASTPAAYVANAADEIQGGINKAGGTDNTTSLPALIKTVINILLFLIGAIAVLAIIIGAIRYVVSGGDSKATGEAKDTILYAVIGLVVAFMAYAIVNFVVSRF